MALSWVSVSATTGRVIADLPTLKVDGALKRTLMRYESQTASLPVGDRKNPPPENWRQATRKGAAFLVALDEANVPLWGGMVVRRNTSEGSDAKLTLASAEAYFDRVYVGDVQFEDQPQNIIVKTLIESYAAAAQGGIPIRVEIVGSNGALRSQAYKDLDDKTLYSVLTGLSGLLGGPEWTVGWEWVDSQTLGLVATVGDRVGSTAPAGLEPAAQFYLPGNVTTFDLDEGYTSGEGANDVTATSSEARSPRQVTANSDGRPRFEYRWSPDANVATFDDLVNHAVRGLDTMKEGTVALKLDLSRHRPPYLGRDWNLGDDIGFDLTAPAWPKGVSGTARAVGWELTDNTVTPLIDVTGIEGMD